MNNEQSQIRRDYRIFVGAFPTGDLTERIQALRHYGPATLENEAETLAWWRYIRRIGLAGAGREL